MKIRPKDKLMGDFSSGREGNGENIDDLVTIAKESGHVDLYRLSPEQISKLADWYRSDFESLSEDDKIEFLEQFMIIGEFSDNESFKYINQIDPDKRAEVGLFIYKVLDGLKFVRTFYECWNDIDYNDRDKIKYDIIENNQELVLMIAPFVILKNWSSEGKFMGRRRSSIREEKPSIDLQKEHFNDFDRSSELIKHLLEYAQNHSDNQDAIAGNLSNIDPILLIPYLSVLENLDILSQDQIEKIISAGKDYISQDLFITSDERQEKESLLKELKDYYPEKDDRVMYYQLSELSPRKLGVKLSEINDRISIRKAETILGTFKQRSHRLKSDKIEYLIELLDVGVPVFSQIDYLGLSKEEISNLFSRCISEGTYPIGQVENLADMKCFVEYSQDHALEQGPDLDQILMSFILQDIQENDQNGMVAKAIAVYADNFFDCFRHIDRQKIIDTINRSAPTIWLNNLHYAIKHEVMPLNELIERTANDARNFIAEYDKISYHLHLLELEGRKTGISANELIDKAKESFINEPSIFLYDSSKRIIDSIYTKEEQHQFISEQLSDNVNPDFFVALLDSRFKDEYLEDCLKLLRDNGYLLSALTEYNRQWDNISTIINRNNLIDLVTKHSDDVDFKTVFEDDLFVAALGKSLTKAENLVDRLTESENFVALAQLNIAINKLQNKEQGLKNKLQRLERRKSLQSDDEFYKKEIASTKAELKAMGNVDRTREKENLIALENKTLSILDEACQENKFLVFEDDVMKTPGLDTVKYITRDLPDYIVINPAILFARDIRSGSDGYELLCRNVLGNDRLSQLMADNKRLLAFRNSEYDTSLHSERHMPKDVADQVGVMNPLIEIASQDKLNQDYYLTVLDKIRNTPFAELYLKELEKIALEKNRANGLRLNIKFFEPDESFKRMAKRIFLLSSHPGVVKHADWIMQLPNKQRSDLINLLEFSLMNNFSFIGQILEAEDLAEVIDNLQEDVEYFMLRTFNMEGIDDWSFEYLSPDSIRALIVYYNQTCKKNNRRNLMFRDFITHTLNGTYETWRKWGSNIDPEDKSSSLKQLQENKLIPRGLDVKQYQAWNQEDKLDLEEIFDYQVSDVKSGIREIIGTAIADEHITDERLDPTNIDLKYDGLVEPLRLLTNRQKELRGLLETDGLSEQQEREYKELSKKIIEYRKEYGDQIDAVIALKYLEGLKKISVHDLTSESITIDGKNRIPFKKVFSLLEKSFGTDFPDFVSDLDRMRQLIASGFGQINGQKISKEKIHLTDKIDLETYVFIGERPVNSCQNYGNRSGMNDGLLSYLTDPGVKIIQVYNESGSIVARSVIRLLEDDKGNPQLFIERIYSSSPHPKITEAIINLARLKANSMGIGLYASKIHNVLENESDREWQTANLHSHGSRNTHVYTDAGGGKMPNGRFTIRKAKLVSA